MEEKRLGVRRPPESKAESSNASVTALAARIENRARQEAVAASALKESPKRGVGCLTILFLMLLCLVVGLFAGMGMNVHRVEKSFQGTLGAWAGDAFHRVIVWERGVLQ